MLHVMREKFTGWIAAGILALIAVTFVFVGGANFTFVGTNYAAKVDDSEIGIGQFEQAYRDQLQQNPQFADLPEDLRMQLRRNVLEQLIQQRVVDNYLAEAGYRIPDQMVTEIIQQIPEFQVDGKFDIETYRNVLAMSGFEPSLFELDRRIMLQRNQLERAIRGTAMLTPAAYREYLNLAGEQRVVAMATLDADTVADEISITEEMINAYYDDNPTLYQVPEKADVQYVEVLRSDVAESVSVSEDELIEYYEFNQDRYLQDEQRQARHILILFGDDEDAAEAKARALLERANAGEMSIGRKGGVVGAHLVAAAGEKFLGVPAVTLRFTETEHRVQGIVCAERLVGFPDVLQHHRGRPVSPATRRKSPASG